MAIEPFVEQDSNCISGHPQFTMVGGDFEAEQVNKVSRSNSEVAVDNFNNSSSRSLNFGMDRQRGASDSSMPNMQQQQQQQRRRATDPFEMFLELKRQQSQKLHQMGGNAGDNGSLQSGSSMSSFQRINTLGSFANMGSLSKMSSSDMSLVLSSQEPVNGRNNQSWGNPNFSGMNERMHSSLPIMNSSYGRIDTCNSNQSMRNMSMGMNTGRNMKFNPGFTNHRPNEFMHSMMDGFPFNNNGGTPNNFQQSGGFNDSRNGAGDFDNTMTPTMNPRDMSKLTNEQLRQMIMMDAIGNSSICSRRVSVDSGSNHGIKATNKSNSEHSASSNPFLKNLGIMNYRNHVMPMTIERHSNKSRTSESSGDLNTTSHSSVTMDFNQSNSNFSFHTEQEDHGTMPDENESYNAAANGILAPWSARAAGLFGDMMIQSTEDEKAKKASRKKPKDKPKRPLSAYNIFFKEERNRILKGEDADTQGHSVPTTITVNDALDTSTKSDVSNDPIPNESRSSVSTCEDAKLDPDKGDKGKKKIGFESLAKLIGRRWQELDQARMAVYKSKASVDMERYKREMEVWEAKHGTSSSRKRKASNSSNKKSKRGDISSSSAHVPSSPVSSPQQIELPRRNSTGGSLDLSRTSVPASSKRPQQESDSNASFRDLSKARLGTDLFRLTEVEEDTSNGMV